MITFERSWTIQVSTPDESFMFAFEVAREHFVHARDEVRRRATRATRKFAFSKRRKSVEWNRYLWASVVRVQQVVESRVDPDQETLADIAPILLSFFYDFITDNKREIEDIYWLWAKVHTTAHPDAEWLEISCYDTKPTIDADSLPPILGLDIWKNQTV